MIDGYSADNVQLISLDGKIVYSAQNKTNSFTINVEDKNVSSDDTNIGQTNPEPNEELNKTPVQENANTTETQKNEQLPAELPKTGYNYYVIFGTIILVISIVAFLIRVRKNKLYGK